MTSPATLDVLLSSWEHLHRRQDLLCRDYLCSLSRSDIGTARQAAARMDLVASDIAKVEGLLSPLLARSAV